MSKKMMLRRRRRRKRRMMGQKVLESGFLMRKRRGRPAK